MDYNSTNLERRSARRLLVTLAAIGLPLVVAAMFSGGIRIGNLQMAQVLGVTSAHAQSAHGGQAVSAPVADLPQGGCSPSANASISITDNSFNPSSITVSPGTRVTWTNNGSDRHRVRDVNHDLFDSDDLDPGQSFSYVFCDPGTYRYEDARDDFTGTIVVSGNPGPTATRTATSNRTATPGATNPPGATNTPQRTNTPVASAQVNIFDDDGFEPEHITLRIGTTVRWTNHHDDEHTITSPGNFNSGDVDEGQSWSFNFTRPGTYNYFCAYHEEMQASVTVTCDDCTPTPAVTPTVVGGNVDVPIQNFAFVPQNLTILVGTTVRWTNQDSTPHTATSPGNFDSGTLNQGQSYQRTFTTPGTFNYFCAFHPGMTGTITVTSGGGNTPTPQPTQPGQSTNTPARTNTPQATNTPIPPVTGTPGGATNVAILNFAFAPQNLTVQAGTTVRWTNQDPYPHTATSPGNFDSGLLNQGQSYQFTFNTPGTYSYFCAYHPAMVGTIVVTGGGSTPTPAVTNTAQPTSTATRTPVSTGTTQATNTPQATRTASTTNTPTPQATATPDGAINVAIQDFAFSPQNLTIDAGQTVRWTNQDPYPHTATSPGNFDSSVLNQGQSYQFTFNTPGTYSYFCAYHPGMTGTIVVTSGGSTPTPTGTRTAQATGTAQATNTAQATITATATRTRTPTPTGTRTAQTTGTAQATITAQATNTPGAAVEIAIQNFAFVPQNLTVQAGTTVRWTNNDTYPHTATSPGNFDSGNLNQGQSYQFTFNTPGTYGYFCAYHPAMTGTIVVTGGGSTATPTAVGTGTPQLTNTATGTAATTGTAQPTNTSTPGATGTVGSTATPTETRTAQPSSTPAGMVDADIRNYAFEPQNIAVAAGQTVRWTNRDNDLHTVTAENNLFNSGILNQGQSWSFTFTTPGSYTYYCIVHPSMRGTIIVTGSTPTSIPQATLTRTATPRATGTAQTSATAQATGSATPATTAIASPTATMAPGQRFSDVLPADYFYVPVNWLVSRGVISGYADGTFRPYNNATRGQVTKMVVLGEGWAVINPQTPTFSDVQPDHPFYIFIETAVQHGIISGYADNTFRPFNNVTRGQLAKIIVLARGWNLANPSTPTFNDVPADSPFYTFIETAVQHGIISGYADVTFRPGNNATRGQISKILYNALTTDR